MLDGHAGWPQDKRCKHEERGVNPTNALSLAIAPVPHPPIANKPRKTTALCLHKDGAQLADLSTKRGPDERKDIEGPSDKRRKNEQGAASTSSASGKVTAMELHPAAFKKPRNTMNLCLHQRPRSLCQECGSGVLCQHQRLRSRCKECGGFSFCEHQRRRSLCQDCACIGLCLHQRPRSLCQECGCGCLCQHQRPRSQCRYCGSGSFCEH